MRRHVIILGAAGRDFHNFNVLFRDNTDYEVVAFTATQIPDIEDRKYPPELAGKLYPDGIPIYAESELPSLIRKYNVELVVFAYSDVPHEYVMHIGSLALAMGTDYMLLGPDSTMVQSIKPLIAIGAVRTGAGKSQTTRRVCNILKELGKKLVVIRHPMPYGNLAQQAVQRFETYKDLEICTIEEREEYEPHLAQGNIVYAGVDYERILRQAEQETNVVIWDGGNNDFPFYKSDLFIVVTDPLRAGDEIKYHPGETCLRMANVVIINKMDTAKLSDIKELKGNIQKLNPEATIIEAESPVFIDQPSVIKNKSVLVIEDGPTLTHGGMAFGAGFVAAEKFGAKEIIDPRNYAVGSIEGVYKKYPHIGAILPAMGYREQQIKELETTINKVPCEAVIVATPIDLKKIVDIKKPSVRATYKLKEISKPDLEDILTKWVKTIK